MSGSGSSFTRDQPHQPLTFFDIEYEIGLRAHQPLRGRGAVEVGRDQLLDFDGLKPNVAPQPGDIAIEQNDDRSGRQSQVGRERSSASEPGGCLL